MRICGPGCLCFPVLCVVRPGSSTISFQYLPMLLPTFVDLSVSACWAAGTALCNPALCNIGIAVHVQMQMSPKSPEKAGQ